MRSIDRERFHHRRCRGRRWSASLKSSSTALRHLGHLGSSRDSITYIMHRGHPARTMAAAPPLPPGAAAASGLPSDDTHELGGDAVDDEDEDTRRGDEIVLLPLLPSPPGRAVDDPPPLALDRPSLRNSSFDALPLFLLILAAPFRFWITSLGFEFQDVLSNLQNTPTCTLEQDALPWTKG